MLASPIPKPAAAVSGPCTWPASSTAPARCFTSAAARSGGCGDVDPAYFEVLYTKLIRHVSQGRILRGSSRGALLVERDRYELGETVVVRARLSDAQHKPLTDDSVTAQLLRPDGATEPVKLTAEADRPGMYVGQATVLQEGTYQLALSLPGSNEEPLSRYLQVRVPDLERTHAERNEPLLASIAKETGGIYYKQLDAAIHGDGLYAAAQPGDQKPRRSEARQRRSRQRICQSPNALAARRHRRLAVSRMDRATSESAGVKSQSQFNTV